MTTQSSTIKIQELWRLLRRVGHLTLNVRNNELSRYGISTAEAGVLALVHNLNGKATPAEISRQILRKAHTISGLVAGLHRKGLVHKVNDAERKNIVRVSLTEKGEEIYCHVRKMDSILRMLDILSEAEQDQLMASLNKLRNRAIEVLAETAKSPFKHR
ncbi:MAG: winged helix DNA-binding protein [Chloroflexi bacterium]|nr:winged helix DNA-binding protein [Chloroflexota bacterium]